MHSLANILRKKGDFKGKVKVTNKLCANDLVTAIDLQVPQGVDLNPNSLLKAHYIV